MIIDFNDRESASIKSFALKKKNEINVTSCFMSGKLLMFAKLSLKSFTYALVETFCFPSQLVLEIYKKYKIEKVKIKHVLTDTHSTALHFIIISDPNSDLSEPILRYNIVWIPPLPLQKGGGGGGPCTLCVYSGIGYHHRKCTTEINVGFNEFNPIQDGHFWAAHEQMEGSGAKRPPSLKSVTHILQWWLRTSIKLYESCDTSLEFCCH